MKDILSGKILIEFVGLREKTYSYLTDASSEDKRAKDTKKCVIKRTLKLENYKNCSVATQLENKVNYVEKTEFIIDCFKEDHKKTIKNNQLILKIQKRFKSKRLNVFTEEINKITLSSNNDKRMQSTDSIIEIYAYRTNKDLVSEKEEIKCNNISKRYKND